MLYTLEQYSEKEKIWMPIVSNHDISKVSLKFQELENLGLRVRIVSPQVLKQSRPSQVTFDFSYVQNIISQADRVVSERLSGMLRGKIAATDLGEFMIRSVSFYNNRVNLSDGDTHWNGTLEELTHKVTIYR